MVVTTIYKTVDGIPADMPKEQSKRKILIQNASIQLGMVSVG